MHRAACLTLLGLLALAPALHAQDEEVVRPILSGEKASIVFSPHGGYATRNFLKRFKAGEQQTPTWASQNGGV